VSPRRKRTPRRQPKGKARPHRGGAAAPDSRISGRLARPTAAVWTVGLLLVAVPLVFDPRMAQAFRPPKLWLAELLALVSLILLTGRLLGVERVVLRTPARWPAVQVVAPMALAVVLSGVVSAHPLAVREALVSFAIGAAALVGWSAGIPRPRLRGLLTLLLFPATLLAVLGVLQFHDLFRPFDFTSGLEETRLGVTGLAGNPADLGAFLVLAAGIAQVELLRRRGVARWAVAAAVALLAYGVVVTQSLTAIAALGASSLVLWLGALPRKRRLPVLAAGIAAAVVLVALVAPVRERVVTLGRTLARGEINQVLTGRLDGWRVAGRMLADRPIAGVGHGAFESSFADAKLELVDKGVPFYRGQAHVMFANAHNELLEVGAEWGFLGLLALGWAFWVVVRRLRSPRRKETERGDAEREDLATRALGWSGLTALVVLSLTFFPLRLALTGYPFLVFLAWVLAPDPAGAESSPESSGDPGVKGRVLFWVLLPLLVGALVLQGQRCRDQWRAARMLRVVEFVTGQMVRTGRVQPSLLWRHVRLLEDAARLDPADAAIPLAKGSHYRLLGRAEEAQEAYRRALALEPRPETWLNLGAAQEMAGHEEAARKSFLTAVRLDPQMRRQVPQPYRDELPPIRELLNEE